VQGSSPNVGEMTMAGRGKTWRACICAAMVASTLLAHAGAPKGANPALSVEPTEAQLPPVDPAWHQKGWRAVVPHAYVLRRLVAARARPDPTAPAVFWLNGGVRVPVLEQGRDWWRVGWSRGRTGWMRVGDLEPHASFVLIDAQSGSVLRRMAAKGEDGPVADGRFLWSLANTGLTRTSLGEPSAIWSNAVKATRDDGLPASSAWTPDRSQFFMNVGPEGHEALYEATTDTGTVRLIGALPNSRLLRADRNGRLLIAQGDNETGSHAILYDAANRRELGRVPGMVEATARTGFLYVNTPGNELVRYSPSLKPGPRMRCAPHLESVCVSADDQILALSYQQETQGKMRLQLRRADTLAPIARLAADPERDPPDLLMLFGGPGGWAVLASGDRDLGTRLTQFTRQGRRVRSWGDDDGSTAWCMSPDRRTLYLARASDILVVDTSRGTSRRIPFRWRRPLPQKYLPRSSDSETPTRLDVAALTLTPDGHTLILTEWLNGDPET
jgi:hypothetical protein